MEVAITEMLLFHLFYNVLVTLGIQKAPKWYSKQLPNVVKQRK